MTKIIAIGEALFDYFPGQKVLGGAPLNFAIHSVQLGTQASLLTRVGEDLLGEEIFDELALRGVDIQYLQWDRQRATGKVEVIFDEHNGGNPTYLIKDNMAWDNLEFKEQFTAEFNDYDCLYFGTLAQRNKNNREVMAQILNDFSGFKCLDLNLRKPFVEPHIINQSIMFADGLKLNLPEAEYLQTELNYDRNIQNWLAQYNLQWIVLTEGELGTTWIDRSNIVKGESVSFTPHQNADAVGTGDAVCAVTITQYLAGLSPQEIVKNANQIGAYVASCPGATPFIPLNLLV